MDKRSFIKFLSAIVVALSFPIIRQVADSKLKNWPVIRIQHEICTPLLPSIKCGSSSKRKTVQSAGNPIGPATMAERNLMKLLLSMVEA